MSRPPGGDGVEDWRADRVGAALAGANPTVMAHLPSSFAVFGDVQFLPGCSVALTDRPGATALADLPRAERLAFLADVDLLATAVESAVRVADPGFRRMNVEILGNTDAFLHAHLFPRYEWEPDDRRTKPVWLYPPDRWTDPRWAVGPQHAALRAAITAELHRLLPLSSASGIRSSNPTGRPDP